MPALFFVNVLIGEIGDTVERYILCVHR